MKFAVILTAIVVAGTIIALTAYGQHQQGKGPGPGCAGLLAWSLAATLTLVELGLIAYLFW